MEEERDREREKRYICNCKLEFSRMGVGVKGREGVEQFDVLRLNCKNLYNTYHCVGCFSICRLSSLFLGGGNMGSWV